MERATAHPSHRCISSEDVQGTEVYGADGKHIGEIDHLIIDKISGRVGYAIMSFGGFLGLGHSHYPIPWGALSYDKSLGGFRTNITEGQLRDAPEFSDDSWQDRRLGDPDASSLRYIGILGNADGHVARKRNAVRYGRALEPTAARGPPGPTNSARGEAGQGRRSDVVNCEPVSSVIRG